MANRFSRIKQGAELNQALDNYVDYIRNAANRPTKRMQGGTRGARRKTVVRAVIPFGVDVDGIEVYEVRVGQDSAEALAESLGAQRLITPAADADIKRVKGFKPARVVVFAGNGSASYVASKITKQYYLKYEGDSYSAPFGATTETEEEAAGARLVKSAVKTQFAAKDIIRISFQPERIPI